MTRLRDIVVVQQNSTSQIVGWRYIPFQSKAPAAARVTVSRSYSESGEFVELDTLPATQGWFEDETVNLNDRWTFPFYKLALKDGAKNAEYGPFRVKGSLDHLSTGLVKHNKTYLRLAGVPVLIYQGMVDGERCIDCFDPVLNKSTRASCPTCFGTGFLKGYADPIFTLAATGVEARSNQVSTRINQVANIEMMLSNFPVVRPTDVVYIVDTGRRYTIDTVAPAEKHLALIHQIVMCSALKPKDIENGLPIPDLAGMKPVLRRRRAVHRFVSSTDGETFNDRPHGLSKI